MPRKKPEKIWQYVLPCAFFDGPNEFLYETQGWRKTKSSDVVSSAVRFWNMEALGSSTPDEKWATERYFANDYSDIIVATYDIFDKGIVMMVWWREGKESAGLGLALKESGKWTVMQPGEFFSENFDCETMGEKRKIVRVKSFEFRIFREHDHATIVSIKIFRD